jgi:transposase InsO family protein
VTAYKFIQANLGTWTVTEMAALFGVSASAYYRWAKHGVSLRRQAEDAELLELIRGIVERHKRRYGSPRVRRELRELHGKRVSLKRVARLMREDGLNARRGWRRPHTTDSGHGLGACENVLNRDFRAEEPGRKWVSDITYLRILGGWLYLTVVLDLFDRKVVGWAFSDRMDTGVTVVAALGMAVKNRSPLSGLIFHSDRGSQYCSHAFRKALRAGCPDVRRSMSRKGECWDNACAESFFATLKRELEGLDGRRSAAEVRRSVFMYIETYYNRVRAHSAIDFVAPDVFKLGRVA